jgi:hypothetical protein
MNFFNTFRGRLLVILAFLLVATVGVQYYLNYLSQQENIELRDAQAQALVAGIAVGFNGLTGNDRLQVLVDAPDQTFLDEASKDRIRDIIIIDNNWRVTDSLNPAYLPTEGDKRRANLQTAQRDHRSSAPNGRRAAWRRSTAFPKSKDDRQQRK